MKQETKQPSGIVAKVHTRNSGSGIMDNSFDGRELHLHCGEGFYTEYHGKDLLFLAFRSSSTICIENIHNLFICETLFNPVLCKHLPASNFNYLSIF